MAGRRFVMSSRRFSPSGRFGGFVFKLTSIDIIAIYKPGAPPNNKLILRREVKKIQCAAPAPSALNPQWRLLKSIIATYCFDSVGNMRRLVVCAARQRRGQRTVTIQCTMDVNEDQIIRSESASLETSIPPPLEGASKKSPDEWGVRSIGKSKLLIGRQCHDDNYIEKSSEK